MKFFNCWVRVRVYLGVTNSVLQFSFQTSSFIPNTKFYVVIIINTIMTHAIVGLAIEVEVRARARLYASATNLLNFSPDSKSNLNSRPNFFIMILVLMMTNEVFQ